MTTDYLTKKNVTLMPFGEDCLKFAMGESTFPKAETFNKPEYADCKKRSDAIFVHLNHLCKMRQSNADNPNEIKARYDLFKSNLLAFYSLIGERVNGKRKMNAIAFTDEKNGEQTADIAVLGKLSADCAEMTEKDAFTNFYHSLCLYAGNILAGNGKIYFDLKEVRTKDMKAQKAKNAERAEKAKATKAANEAAKAETKKNQEAITQELEALRKNAINVTELIARINATSATDEEKKSLIDWIVAPKAEAKAI